MVKRVHITLVQDVLENLDLLEQIKASIVEATGMTDVNERRLHRYGILSGNVEFEKVPMVSSFQGVASVDLDEERHALR